MPSATLTSKGQITLPKRVRELLQLKAGDQVDFVVGESRQVTLRAASLDVAELRGLLRRRGRRPVSVAAMDAAIRREHSRKR